MEKISKKKIFYSLGRRPALKCLASVPSSLVLIDPSKTTLKPSQLLPLAGTEVNLEEDPSPVLNSLSQVGCCIYFCTVPAIFPCVCVVYQLLHHRSIAVVLVLLLAYTAGFDVSLCSPHHSGPAVDPPSCSTVPPSPLHQPTLTLPCPPRHDVGC